MHIYWMKKTKGLTTKTNKKITRKLLNRSHYYENPWSSQHGFKNKQINPKIKNELKNKYV